MASKHSKHITPPMRKTCEGCGVEVKRTYKSMCKDCGVVNRQVRMQRLNRVRKGRDHLPPLLFSKPAIRIPKHTCKACARVYRPKVKDRVTFCSRECSWDWQKAKAAMRLALASVSVTTYRLTCRSCNVRYSADRLGSSLCQACRENTSRYYTPIMRAQCVYCGVDFSRDADGATMYMCSVECKSKSVAKAKRENRKRRKALERGARRAEQVDPLEVFERDGWRCQMCRCKTPARLRGTYEPKAPELDHIMPLSKGGEHTYRNTQLLCRACNAAKSNTPMGQLSLL